MEDVLSDRPENQSDTDEAPGPAHKPLTEAKLLAALVVMLVGAWAVFMLVAPDTETARSNLQAEPQGPARERFVISAPERLDLTPVLSTFQTTMSARVQTAAAGGGTVQSADLMVVDGTELSALIKQGALQPIDLRTLRSAQNLGPQVQQWASVFDPDTSYGVPVFWEALAMEVAPDRMVSRIANPIAPDSLSILFQPEIADDLVACGLAVQSDARAAFAAALIYLGIDPATASPEQVEQAANLLEVNNAVLRYGQSSASEEAAPCVRVGYYSGHGFLQPDKALALPREGTALKLYFLAIPTSSKAVEQATAFIDHMLRSAELADMAQAAGLNTSVLNETGRHPDATERMLLALTRAKMWPPAPDAQAGLKARRWRLITSNAEAAPEPEL